MKIGESEIRLFRDTNASKRVVKMKMANFNIERKVQTKIDIRN